MAVDTTVQVTLPQMGESVTEGTVLEWHKQEGDRVELDDTIVEISTDKVDAEIPAPVAGTLVRRLAAEGDTVTAGSVIAEIRPGTDGGAAGRSAERDGPAGAAADQPASTAAEPAGDGAATGEVVDIVTPAGGESVTEATILEWSVAVGEAVEDGQTVVELSTDKVDMELPAPGAGVITEILAGEGDTVTPHQVIARMELRAGAAGPRPAAATGNGAAATAPATTAPATAPAAPAEGTKASPVAQRVAAAEGVDLGGVRGTGPGGRITKADVLDAKSGNGAAAVAAAKPAGAQPLRGGAAMLARYMDESRAIPTATSFRTMTVTAMDARRRQLKDAGQKVSFTHLIAYAIARAATDDLPVMAHHFAEIDGKPHRLDDGAVHLGIAVDVEKKDGSRTLMVPVIRDAGRLSFKDFKAAFDDLIARARSNALTADDLTGANLSLTNPGGIGTVASVPRLMTGQGTIVATGSIAYPVGLGAIGDMIGAEKVMTMTSTYDHRIIQGAESGRFLQVVEDYLQGSNGFYEGVFASLGADLGPAPQPAAPAAAAAAARTPVAAPAGPVDEELLQAVQAATSVLKAHRTHGHLAARLDPLGTEPEGDPALDPATVGLTPELMAKIPARILRMGV
ncbi:MAG TPA: 2-oxo acid dehydrogenase subunit E2, partial [Solirubrobacteraceae bacterium]|nr:2-oxo acid dehydrogenase subunit E2 [Solirubrobacteraceae bacterium]